METPSPGTETLGISTTKLYVSMAIHDMFHICYLRPYGDDGKTKSPHVPEIVDDEPNFETLIEAMSVSPNICHAVLAMVLSMTCGRMRYHTVPSWVKNIDTENLSLRVATHLYG